LVQLHLVSLESDFVRFRIDGELRVEETEERRPFESMLGADCYSRALLLNLEACNFIDSSGIGWLIVQHRLFERGGGRFILHDAPAAIEQALAFARMHSFLTIARDLAEARQLRSRA
jgi:anti-anti-sigma factor